MSKSAVSTVAAVLMLVGSLCVPAAMAQTPEYSVVSFTEPTDVGGTVLQPGQYLIQVLPGFSSRNRVQITDVNRDQIFATLLTVPHALAPNEEMPNTTLVYYPAIPGQPRALRTWFPPDTAGHEGHDIVYEETRAMQLARAANSPVVSYRGTVETTAQTTPEFRTVTPDARVETYVVPQQTTRVTTTTTREVPVQTAEVRTTTTTTRTELPRTASELPLLAILGVLAMAGAVAIRFVNR